MKPIKIVNKLFIIVFFLWEIFLFSAQKSERFILYSTACHPVIIVDQKESEPVHTAAELLARDIEHVTGFRPEIKYEIDDTTGPMIVIGTLLSQFIGVYPEERENLAEQLSDRWEVYTHRFKQSVSGEFRLMMIFGSDPRGAAYGVFDLSGKIGVSPWYWWADVNPRRQEILAVPAVDFTSKTPSVKYRGIFLNDEDWGLQPWAARTFEPETGDIGPKTYAKIFELLLRLRANFIWPAMHSCTKAFFSYSKNPEMARKYGIVIGSSHAEPMLRNNVGEWNPAERGDFNYNTGIYRVTYKY